ncbi:TPA: 30S ribosomal protein S15 [Candidatus Saccharibacteria bacterium]|nr:MAG: 30S ribosomal protein S15 [Candidatus Saccharibacteria bacterium GW2011_GWA2_46_10]OGL36286.1 MAG: 30S ribosomal protein S15 [Candidatus Saccharibacteria bacterium RIFCSPHIGHO2_12_FULL_47_17]HCM51938.1 30S ribosomal protein S15 [Candidatus Saccharibacteria bacterium]
MISTEKKAEIAKDLRTKDNDTGSPAVQVGIMTARIAELTAHLKSHKHDFAARRALLQLVGKRKRLLKYISNQSEEAYIELIKKLGIRR